MPEVMDMLIILFNYYSTMCITVVGVKISQCPLYAYMFIIYQLYFNKYEGQDWKEHCLLIQTRAQYLTII